jgi:putative protein-disulfide isomerase
MNAEPIMWYFADPMCSWCWGFSPVAAAIRDRYRHRMRIALMLGGLRPGTTDPVTAEFREQTLQHWRDVQHRTGQEFTFEGALPDGFVYDTEPACRAVVTVGEISPDAAFAYFTSIQAAFYTGLSDVTSTGILAALAAAAGVPPTRFMDRFSSDEIKARTQTHFQRTREVGIRGFPTVVLENAGGYTLLTSGYRPLSELQPEIEAWLEAAAR